MRDFIIPYLLMEDYIFSCWRSTDQLFSGSGRKKSLKHVHEEFPAVGDAMSVLQQREQEPLVVLCTPATEPAKSKQETRKKRFFYSLGICNLILTKTTMQT